MRITETGMGQSRTRYAMIALALCASISKPTVAQIAAPGETIGLEEIVVTAEKRESTVQKTPISITAFSGDALAAQGTVNMLAVAEETPGVSFRTSGTGQTEFEIRGLASSGGATATVGYYFDDVPISPPALGDIGKVVIDPNLYDISRVEVLRGPQGTLYGAGSEGGTIKIVTNPAKLGVWEAAADGTVSGTDGGGINRGINALLNATIGEKAALRFVVSSSFTDGWIDRIVENPFPFPTNTGCTPTAFAGCARGDVLAAPNKVVIPRVNTVRQDSARANIYVNPGDNLEVRATAMYQRTLSGAPSTFDSPPGTDGPLAHYEAYNTLEPVSDDVRLVSFGVQYSFERAQLTSSSSYWNRGLTQFQEGSELNVNLYGLPQFYTYGRGDGTQESDNISQFAQEVRLASSGSEAFQWLIGGFYSNLKYQWSQSNIDPGVTGAVYATGLYAPVTAAQNPDGILYLGVIPYHLTQSAAFTELSYQFAPAFKLAVGGRYFNYRTVEDATQSGIFTQSVSAVPTITHSDISASGFNPKATLDYTPTDDLTLYSTVAKGFRPGGINLPLPAQGPNSCTAALTSIGQGGSSTSGYNGDSVLSYELGEKARVADGRISINGAVYYIRWNNIQQLLPLSCGYFYTVNAGDARSYGSELEVQARIDENWSLTGTGGYTNATINNPAPDLNLAPGTPILNIPKYTGSAAVVYSHPLTAGVNLTVRAAATYFGALTDEAYTYVRLPGYTLTEARIGFLADRWTVYLTGTNLTNKIAELSANNTSLSSNQPDFTRITTNQPRTVGVQASTKF